MFSQFARTNIFSKSNKSTGKIMDKSLLMSLVVKDWRARVSKFLGLAIEDGGNVSMPSSPPHPGRQGLSSKWATFMVLDKVTDIFLRQHLRSRLL